MLTTNELVREENRRIRLIRIASDLLVHVLMTRPVSQAEAEKMISGLRKLVLKLFPGKEHVFDLIYLPRFRRAFREAGGYNHQHTLKILDGGKARLQPMERWVVLTFCCGGVEHDGSGSDEESHAES